MEKVKNFLFYNTTTKQTFAKNTLWLFLSETFGRLLKMFLVIYAARVLGVSGWGVFSYAISIGALLMIFSDIGLSGLITREAVQKKEGHLEFISTALFLKCIILLISTTLVLLICPTLSSLPEANALFPIVAAILFFDSMRELGLALNRASEKMEREMIVKTIMNVVILVLGIILLKAVVAPASMALAYAIGSALGFFIIAFMIRNDIRSLVSKIDKKVLKLVLETTWPFALITLIGSIMGNTDIFMLGIWKDSTEIGLYASVQRIQQFILIVPGMVASASFPIMSRLAHTDNNQFKLVLEKILSFIMIIAIPISFGGIALGVELVQFIFGSGYLGAVPILRILMAMLLISFPLLLLSNAVFAYNRQRDLASANIFGVIANVVLNFILIQQYGAIGSAIATLVSTLIITYIVWVKMEKIQHFELLPKLRKAFVASILMLCGTLLLRYLGIHIVLNVLISSILYVGSLYILKESMFMEVRKILNI